MHTARLATDVIKINAKFQVSHPDSRLFASRRLVCFSAENVIQEESIINVDVEKCDHQKPALIFVEVADCRCPWMAGWHGIGCRLSFKRPRCLRCVGVAAEIA